MVFSIIVIVVLAAVGVFIYKKTQKLEAPTPTSYYYDHNAGARKPAKKAAPSVSQGSAIIRKPTGTSPASSVARPSRTAPRRSYGSSSGYDSSYGNSSYFTSSYDSGSSYSSGGSSSSSCSDSSSSSSSSGGGGCD